MARIVNLTEKQAEAIIKKFTPGYRVKRLLGDGSYGQVFLAEDAESRVAVKILPLSLVADAKERGNVPEDGEQTHEWRQLTRNWDRLNHASLVRNRAFFTYDVDSDSRDPETPVTSFGLIYMDYWPTDLYSCVRSLRKEGRLTAVRQRALLLNLARLLLRLLEDTGLIVTDLKLENIMVGNSEQGNLPLALIDLGGINEARVADYYRVVTTDYYEAPELASHSVTRIDEQILIYSFGVVGIYILEGRWPNRNEDFKKSMMLQLREQGGPQWRPEILAEIPGCAKIVEVCLKESRSERYPSLAVLVAALQDEENNWRNAEFARIRQNFSPAITTQPGPVSGQDKVWQEPITGMVFKWIPKGSFFMGQSAQENKILNEQNSPEYFDTWFAQELQNHRVSLDGFWMAETPVTKGQFAKFAEDTLHLTDSERIQNVALGNPKMWDTTNWNNWRKLFFEQDDRHPVVYISWFDAEAFTQWLSRRTGLIFSLPSEAQWEYACHGGGTSPFHFGANISTDKANYDGDNPVYADGKPGIYREMTTPVASFPANNYGLFDMHGNVWEWCLDHYHTETYSKPEAQRRNPVYRADIGYNIKRGGSWRSPPSWVRAAFRGGTYPDTGKSDLGFRPVLLLKSG